MCKITSIQGSAFALGTGDKHVTCIIQSPENCLNGKFDNAIFEPGVIEYKKYTTLEYSNSSSGTDGNIRWEINGSVLRLTGTGDMKDYGNEDGNKSPWRANKYMGNVTEVIIENGITGIGVLAFAYCESVKTVSIPDSVVTIRANAFQGCTSLEYVDMPSAAT